MMSLKFLIFIIVISLTNSKKNSKNAKLVIYSSSFVQNLQ